MRNRMRRAMTFLLAKPAVTLAVCVVAVMSTSHAGPTALTLHYDAPASDWEREALPIGNGALGAIKVYADQPGTFDRRSEQLLVLFSAQAAILVSNIQTHERAKRLSAGMREAFRQRDTVSVAKGVLMGRNSIDEDTAFAMLMARSEQDGTSLVQAARATVESAERRRR